MKTMNLQTIRARHATEETDAARAALESVGWRLSVAAEALGCSPRALRCIVDGDDTLQAEYKHHRHRGRPSKSA